MELNESCFAFPALRKFPIHTKEDAESSLGAYRMQKNAFTKAQQAVIEANFNKAASYYGFSLEKTAAAPAERKQLWFKGAENGVQMGEIKTFDELEKTAAFIIEKRASVKRAELAEAAKYVMWMDANCHRHLPKETMTKVAHIAGIGVGDREEIQHEFEKRATLVHLDRKNHEAFWKFANDMKALTDEEFYKPENLETVCNVIDNIDFMRDLQHKHASELGYPEDVVFKSTMDDLIDEASDLYRVDSIDATLSKKATLERKDAINGFFSRYFAGHEPLEGEKLIEKVASLDKNTANALLEAIE